MSENIKEKVYLLLDEVIIENPNISSIEEIIGKAPFVLDQVLFPWSKLDTRQVNMIACINPESEDLAQLQGLDNKQIQQLKNMKPSQGPVPTIVMWRVFRFSNKIHEFIKELEMQCCTKHREFGYLIPPISIEQGHEDEGEIPKWIEAPERQHIKCSKSNCSDCFLLSIEESFDEKIKALKSEGIPDEDILVIVSCSALKKNLACTLGKEYLRSKYENLKINSNFEFDGCESNVVIVIRNGGILSFSMSNAISRAISRLILIMPDDQHKILKSCCDKDLLFQENAETSEIYCSSENDDKKQTSENIPFFGSAEVQTPSLEDQEVATIFGKDATKMKLTSQDDEETSSHITNFSEVFDISQSTLSLPSSLTSISSTPVSSVSLDSGVSRAQNEFPKLSMIDEVSGKEIPSVQKTIVHLEEKYGIKRDNALEIIADVANINFGQKWNTEKKAPGKAVRQETNNIKPKTLTLPTKNKDIAGVHTSGTYGHASKVVKKVR